MKFIARKHKSLRIVLDPRLRTKNMGRSTTASLTGVTQLGLTVEFKDGFYDTDDKQTIELLKNHPEYGFSFRSDERVKVEPTVEAIKADNEKKEFSAELRSTCGQCGKKFKTEDALTQHMKTHNQ